MSGYGCLQQTGRDACRESAVGLYTDKDRRAVELYLTCSKPALDLFETFSVILKSVGLNISQFAGNGRMTFGAYVLITS